MLDWSSQRLYLFYMIFWKCIKDPINFHYYENETKWMFIINGYNFNMILLPLFIREAVVMFIMSGYHHDYFCKSVSLSTKITVIVSIYDTCYDHIIPHFDIFIRLTLRPNLRKKYPFEDKHVHVFVKCKTN